MLDRDQDPGDRLLDYLDADSSWALVFVDDAAEVLVRRDGGTAAVARRFGYDEFPAGIRRPHGRRARRGHGHGVPAPRRRGTCRRMAEIVTENGGATHMLGIFAMMEDRLDEARVHLKQALERKPFLPRVHELLGVVAMRQNRYRDAVREFERERALQGCSRGHRRPAWRSARSTRRLSRGACRLPARAAGASRERRGAGGAVPGLGYP